MSFSTVQMVAQGATLAMIQALGQYAREANAGIFTDVELSDLLARFGGSMVQALDFLSSQADQSQPRIAGK